MKEKKESCEQKLESETRDWATSIVEHHRRRPKHDLHCHSTASPSHRPPLSHALYLYLYLDMSTHWINAVRHSRPRIWGLQPPIRACRPQGPLGLELGMTASSGSLASASGLIGDHLAFFNWASTRRSGSRLWLSPPRPGAKILQWTSSGSVDLTSLESGERLFVEIFEFNAHHRRSIIRSNPTSNGSHPSHHRWSIGLNLSCISNQKSESHWINTMKNLNWYSCNNFISN